MFTLIKNVALYTPVFQGYGDIVCVFDKILAIGDSTPYQNEYSVIIDGTGKIAIPGLIDQHVHITGGGGEKGFSSRVPELKLSDFIEAGVTTAVGLLGTDSQTRSVESLLAKTKALKEEGLSAYCLTGAYDYPSPNISGSIEKDILYIEEILGVKLALSDHRGPHITLEELTHLTSKARVAGLISQKPAFIHLHMGTEQKGLQFLLDIVKETDIPIAQFRPTHIRQNTPYAVEFAQKGGWLDFTSGRDGKETALLMQEYMTKVPSEKMTVSSDAGGSQPVWNDKKEIIGITAAKMTTLFDCIRALAFDGGLGLEKALPFATTHVAQSLGLSHKKGQLASGFDADIVLLDGEKNIDTVIARGKIMMQDKHCLMKGLYE